MTTFFRSLSLSIIAVCQFMPTKLFANGAIPDPPSRLCVTGLSNDFLNGKYKYSEANKHWKQEHNNSVLIFVDTQQNTTSTWFLSAIGKDSNLFTFAYCNAIDGGDYYPNASFPGNPTDCDNWVGVNDLDITDDLREGGCISFPTELTGFQWFELVLYLLITIVFMVAMCPVSPLRNKWCNPNSYDAATLDVYEKILALKDKNAKVPRGVPQGVESLRPVIMSQILLKQDLSLSKVAWYGEKRRDCLLYFRLKHLFFSIFYGSVYDEITPKQAVIKLVIIQFITLANVFLLTWTKYSQRDEDWPDALQTITELIFSVLVIIIDAIIVAIMVCKCMENREQSQRLMCTRMGRVGVLCWFVFSVVYCIYIFGIQLYEYSNENWDESIPLDSFLPVFFANYFITQFRGIFVFQVLYDIYVFNKLWKQQTGKKKPDPYNPNCNGTCAVSWMCCCCCCCVCYYMCWSEKDNAGNKAYIMDDSGNVIGRGKQEFAVTFVEYGSYSRGEKLPERNFTRIVQSATGGGSAVTAVGMKDVELNVQGSVGLTVDAQNIATTQTTIELGKNINMNE